MFRVSALARMAPTAVLFNKGRVVTWVGDRGFGFIADDADESKQYFVHFSALKTEAGGYRALTVGQEVEFEVASQDGRDRAENVTAIGGGDLPAGPRPPRPMGGGFGNQGGNFNRGPRRDNNRGPRRDGGGNRGFDSNRGNGNNNNNAGDSYRDEF